MSSVFTKSLLGVLVGRKVTIILIFIVIQIFFQEKTSQRTNEKKKRKKTQNTGTHSFFTDHIHNFLHKVLTSKNCCHLWLLWLQLGTLWHYCPNRVWCFVFNEFVCNFEHNETNPTMFCNTLTFLDHSACIFTSRFKHLSYLQLTQAALKISRFFLRTQ